MLLALAIPRMPAFADTAAERSAALFKQAYAANESQHYSEALAALDEAVKLDSGNASAWHERAYTLNSLGRYREAVDSFNEEVRLRNDPGMLYTERAFAKHRIGDLAGAFADLDHDVKLRPTDPDLLLGRARAALWLGRFEAADADAVAAADFATRAGKAEIAAAAAKIRDRVAMWHAPGQPDLCRLQNIHDETTARALIADCTAAFLAAGTSAAKGEILTTRSTAWPVANETSAAIDDLQVAEGLDPNNWERHANLGFAYVDGRHSTAGLEEFDKAVALGGNGFALYGGRAGAYYNLGKTEEAFADARKSMEIQQNEIAAIVLGDLAANVRKDVKEAKSYWLTAYRLGSRDDRLRERLRSIGVDHPENETAN